MQLGLRRPVAPGDPEVGPEPLEVLSLVAEPEPGLRYGLQALQAGPRGVDVAGPGLVLGLTQQLHHGERLPRLLGDLGLREQRREPLHGRFVNAPGPEAERGAHG